MKLILVCTALFVTTFSLHAQKELVSEQPVSVEHLGYEMDGVRFLGKVAYSTSWTTMSHIPNPPGMILMVPNWMGPTEQSLKKAKEIAAMGYVVYMVDMYGVDVRPMNMEQAGKAAGFVRGDRELMRKRARKALEVFRQHPLRFTTDRQCIAAIGFCFGGGTVLELARSGADVDAVVSFHGDLLSPTLESDSKNIKCRVLVLHGADDPFVPPADVRAFKDAMQQTEADWMFVSFGNAVHSFTDPFAGMPGKAAFEPRANDRSFMIMNAFLKQAFNGKD